MQKTTIILIACFCALFANSGFAAKSYHALYDVTGDMVKPNSTQEVVFADAWNRVEKNNIGVGIGPFANWDRSTKWYKELKIYSVNRKKNGKFNKKGTVADNVMAESFQDRSDSEMEDIAENMYSQLGYAKDGRDDENDCERWTNPQLGEVCLRDRYILIYMNSLGMSYTLRELSYNVDESELDLPNVKFTQAPRLDDVMSGNIPAQGEDYSSEEYDADGANERPKNMKEAMGLIKGLFGGKKNQDVQAPKHPTAPTQPTSVESAAMAAESASDDSGSQ